MCADDELYVKVPVIFDWCTATDHGILPLASKESTRRYRGYPDRMHSKRYMGRGAGTSKQARSARKSSTGRNVASTVAHQQGMQNGRARLTSPLTDIEKARRLGDVGLLSLYRFLLKGVCLALGVAFTLESLS
jgi:hypothetical protein